MNIRCSFCQTPYTLSRVAMLDALQEVDAGNLTHYDAHCPRCRRATQIPRQKLEMAMPNWREELKQFEKEMKEHPQHEAPLPPAESTPVAEAAPAPEASPKKGATKAKPAAKPAEGTPKTAARQTTPSADTKKSNAKKTAPKGTSKKTK
jgi:phage FluMu protein Com